MRVLKNNDSLDYLVQDPLEVVEVDGTTWLLSKAQIYQLEQINGGHYDTQERSVYI